MLGFLILLGLLIILYIACLGLYWRSEAKLSWQAPFRLGAYHLYHIAESAFFVQQARHSLASLHGEKHSVQLTREFLQQLILYVYISFLLGTLLALAMEGDLALACVCWIGSLLIVIVKYRELSAKVLRRKQLILSELPIVLNKMVLLLQAGETLHRALMIAVDGKVETKHPLYTEFSVLTQHLDNRMSFVQGMEEFARRCSVHEVSLFTNTILLNYKRGGEQLADALRSLSGQLWAARKALARTLGEEASSKLVIPMILIFLVVMVIVAAPAIFYMN